MNKRLYVSGYVLNDGRTIVNVQPTFEKMIEADAASRKLFGITDDDVVASVSRYVYGNPDQVYDETVEHLMKMKEYMKEWPSSN